MHTAIALEIQIIKIFKHWVSQGIRITSVFQPVPSNQYLPCLSVTSTSVREGVTSAIRRNINLNESTTWQPSNVNNQRWPCTDDQPPRIYHPADVIFRSSAS